MRRADSRIVLFLLTECKQTLIQKNREAGFGPASYRLAETFSLIKLLSSPQQLFAVAQHSIHKFNFVNPRKLARGCGALWNERLGNPRRWFVQLFKAKFDRFEPFTTRPLG